MVRPGAIAGLETEVVNVTGVEGAEWAEVGLCDTASGTHERESFVTSWCKDNFIVFFCPLDSHFAILGAAAALWAFAGIGAFREGMLVHLLVKLNYGVHVDQIGRASCRERVFALV